MSLFFDGLTKMWENIKGVIKDVAIREELAQRSNAEKGYIHIGGASRSLSYTFESVEEQNTYIKNIDERLQRWGYIPK